jgi:hypothetical protein
MSFYVLFCFVMAFTLNVTTYIQIVRACILEHVPSIGVYYDRVMSCLFVEVRTKECPTLSEHDRRFGRLCSMILSVPM